MATALPQLKALSDETRLRLVHVLNRFELSVNELVTILEMGQSRVSRHLKILSNAGLLSSRRDGLWVFYTAPEEGEGRVFLDAVSPFIASDESLQADVDMAEKMIEERAHKTKQFFNAIAEDWDDLNRDIIGGFDLPSEIIGHMPKCAVALDLGCGTGTLLERMLERAGSVIGVDGSPRMLEMAKRRLAEKGGDVSLRIGELEHLPLRDGEADFAAVNMVLHHLSHPGEALQEIRRILAQNGILVLADFDKHDNEKMRSEYGDRWLGFAMGTLQEKLTAAGFTLVSSSLHPVQKGLSIRVIVAEKK